MRSAVVTVNLPRQLITKKDKVHNSVFEKIDCLMFKRNRALTQFRSIKVLLSYNERAVCLVITNQPIESILQINALNNQITAIIILDFTGLTMHLHYII